MSYLKGRGNGAYISFYLKGRLSGISIYSPSSRTLTHFDIKAETHTHTDSHANRPRQLNGERPGTAE